MRRFSAIGGARLKSCVTFVIGGAKSGKSAFAESLAAENGPVVYIATAEAGDAEMSSRIAAHRSRRPVEWGVWEGDVLSLPGGIKKIASEWDTLLFDSLTMYLSAAMLDLPEGANEDGEPRPAAAKKILDGVRDIFAGFREAAIESNKRLIVVSDEVGCGIVPPYPMGRRFRDLLGEANQIAASIADEAVLVTAGLPLWLKTRATEKS